MHQESPPKFVLSPEFLQANGLATDFPERFWGYVDKNGSIPEHMPHLGPCWHWKASTRGKGYGQIRVGNISRKVIMAHRASWILHFGSIPDGLCVLHHCDRPQCTRPSHLFLGTRGDNHDDMKKKNRGARGESHGLSKLTPEQVEEIRRRHVRGRRWKVAANSDELASEFGVSRKAINLIVNRKRWSHI